MSTGADAVIIDTSCWIEAMRERGDDAVRDQVAVLLESGRARFADVVRLELWNGLGGADEQRFLSDLEDLIETVPTTPAVWAETRALAARSRSRGVTVPSADLLVFACARVHGLGLLHRDTHFDELEKVVGEV